MKIIYTWSLAPVKGEGTYPFMGTHIFPCKCRADIIVILYFKVKLDKIDILLSGV